MKTTRKRKPAKAGRRAGKATTAQLLQDNAGSALRRGRETIGRAYGWAHDAAGEHLHMPRRSDIGHLTEANPLLLGAVGLGIGVAIGTLFPRGMRRVTSGRTARASNGAPAPVKTVRRRRKAKRAAAASA